ncbi:MAG TPA: FtsQ-type POTRA domain-containing protein [Thermoanaerobaculia bacterium]
MNGAVTASVMPAGTGGRVLDFRRRGTPPRRRRKSRLLKLLKPLAVAAGVVAAPAALVAWVLTAPLFRLRTVEVRQAKGSPRRVSDAWVREALAPLTGKNLVSLSLAEATARVQRNPWIAAVEITKDLPGRLRVKIAERRPIALLLAGRDLVFADSDGRAIAPVATPAELAAARKAGLLVVSFPRDPHPDGIGSALKVAAELGRVEPNWAAKLAQIEVLGESEFRLRTDALPFPLLVDGGEVAAKVQRLVALLPELARRYPRIEAVDLRFSRRIVVQPANVNSASPAQGGAGA